MALLIWLDKSLLFVNISDAIMSPPSSLARQIHLGSDHGRDHCRNAATPSAKMLWWFPPLWVTSPSLAESGRADCWQPEKSMRTHFSNEPVSRVHHIVQITIQTVPSQSDQACFDKHMAETRTHPYFISSMTPSGPLPFLSRYAGSASAALASWTLSMKVAFKRQVGPGAHT